MGMLRWRKARGVLPRGVRKRKGLRPRIRRAFGLLGLTRWVVERHGICTGKRERLVAYNDFRSKKSV